MTHGPLSWRELVERDKQKSEDARNQIKRAAMQPTPRQQEAVMQSELKPCAHCGGEAYIDDDTMGHSVVCCKNIECRAQGPFRPTDDEAITAWNTRASDAEITRLTEALRLQMEAKHKEAAEAKLWFQKAQEWKEALRAAEEREKALRDDACRYHWLRDHSCPPHNFYISVPDEFAGQRYAPGEVDAYIDAARAALKGPSHDA